MSVFQHVYDFIFGVGGCGVCGPCESGIIRCVRARCGRQLSTSGLGANLMLTNICVRRERSAEGIRLPSFYRPSAPLCVSFAERGSQRGGSQGFPCAGIKNGDKSLERKEDGRRRREGGRERLLFQEWVSERASDQHTAGFHTSESETEKEFLGEVCPLCVCVLWLCGVCVFERGHIQVFPSGTSGRSVSSWYRHTFCGTEMNPVVRISALLRYLCELAIMWWPVWFPCSSFISVRSLISINIFGFILCMQYFQRFPCTW